MLMPCPHQRLPFVAALVTYRGPSRMMGLPHFRCHSSLWAALIPGARPHALPRTLVSLPMILWKLELALTQWRMWSLWTVPSFAEQSLSQGRRDVGPGQYSIIPQSRSLQCPWSRLVLSQAQKGCLLHLVHLTPCLKTHLDRGQFFKWSTAWASQASRKHWMQ